MKTAEEILEKHLLPMISRTKESYESIEKMKAVPEWSVVINAMEEYAEQQVRNHTRAVSEHLCQYESDNTTAMNCKHCGEPKRSTKHSPYDLNTHGGFRHT